MGPADRSPPNQPVSTEDPAGAPYQGCAWRLDLEGVPATWLPLAWGCWYSWELGVSWTPTLLSAFPPHNQRPREVELRPWVQTLGPGTSRGGRVRVRLSERRMV